MNRPASRRPVAAMALNLLVLILSLFITFFLLWLTYNGWDLDSLRKKI